MSEANRVQICKQDDSPHCFRVRARLIIASMRGHPHGTCQPEVLEVHFRLFSSSCESRFFRIRFLPCSKTTFPRCATASTSLHTISTATVDRAPTSCKPASRSACNRSPNPSLSVQTWLTHTSCNMPTVRRREQSCQTLLHLTAAKAAAYPFV